MTGVICLQGGREFTSPCRDMDRVVLGLVPQNRPIGVLAGAARVGSDYAGASDRARRHYEGFGTQVVIVPDPRTDEAGAVDALTDDLALVVLPGGSPSSLLDVLSGTTASVGRRLVELFERGIGISGASAGAMVLCTRTVLPDRGGGGRRRHGAPVVADGLGLVDGLALPHWTPGDERWPAPADVDLWGLPECGGAIIRGDDVRAVGRGAPARRIGGEWSPLPRP